MAADDALLLNMKKDEAPFPCPACKMENHAPLPGMSIVNREHFSMVMCVHPHVHECPFCHTRLQLIIAACHPPLVWVPIPSPGGIETPAQASMKTH